MPLAYAYYGRFECYVRGGQVEREVGGIIQEGNRIRQEGYKKKITSVHV